MFSSFDVSCFKTKYAFLFDRVAIELYLVVDSLISSLLVIFSSSKYKGNDDWLKLNSFMLINKYIVSLILWINYLIIFSYQSLFP